MAKPRPPFNSKVLSSVGDLESLWHLFFDNLTKKNTKQPVSVTVGASPFVTRADDDGMYIIKGGTVSLIEIQRNLAAYEGIGVIAGPLPVQQGDNVRVTWTVLPTIKFLGG
jgi:hypothetical protein